MSPAAATGIDVHQHLWPSELLEALRGRTTGPRLVDWTLHLDGEPPYEVRPADHDVAARVDAEPHTRLALVSLSSPLGIEDLPPDDARPLLDAWHQGAARLPLPFGAWAATTRIDPDLSRLRTLLEAGFVGLQIPATWIATPALLSAVAPILALCEAADRPVLVHPGPVRARSAEGAASPSLPDWWPAVVDYPAQMQAAWWSWHDAGRTLLPTLRLAFVAGAGLAPVHQERLLARGGRSRPVDPGVFVETSSYGPQAFDALVRVLGIDALVRGSDRPYAEPADLGGGAAAAHAVDVTNPARLLGARLRPDVTGTLR